MNGRATCSSAFDHQSPTHRSDPVGQPAQTGTNGRVGSAHAVIGNLDDRES